MTPSTKRIFAALGAVALASMVYACKSGPGPAAGTGTNAVTPGGSRDPSKWPADDRSGCDWKGKADLEVNETAGPGAIKPNVRRVYKTLGENDNRHKTLICREIDTNLDGIKDVYRRFNAKGEAIREEQDRDYDGKVDTWTVFVDGRIAEEQIDTNKDGRPDVWKFYVNGTLQRIRRDRNGDGKPDVWEIYSNGRLERMGIDDNSDGHVDRWDRDEALRYEQEEAERKARDAMDAGAATPPASGAADAGAPKK